MARTVCVGTSCGSGACAGTWDANAAACDFTATQGASCEDGDLCTTGELCASGTCGGGAAAACDDGDPCTGVLCDPGAGCLYEPLNGVACDDSDVCTQTDTCSSGLCHGSNPLSCDDSEACTLDSCNAASGCENAPRTGNACNDSDACTTGDTCSAGTCVGGAPPSCNDANTCTADSCVSPTGCQHAPLTGDACDDASLCTTGETCQAGACTGGTVAIVCDDGDACTNDFCVPATGQCGASTLNTGANDPCDGVDDDCDGLTDEDHVGAPTSCGLGQCAATGVTTCVSGAVVDACTPGAPQQELCADGLDSDCDGQDSNGFVDQVCGGDTAIYLAVRDALGVPRYTARCTQPPGGGPVTCETDPSDPTGQHLKLYDGLLCPGGNP